MDPNIVFAHLCYVARFRVTNNRIGGHLQQRGWKKQFSQETDRDLFSGKAICRHVSSFLGATRDTSELISAGECYTVQVQDLLSGFNNKRILVQSRKHKSTLPLELYPTLQIHLSPGNNAGMLMLCFHLPSKYPDLYDMEDLINLHYYLQKTDAQAPCLVLEKTGETVAGLETLPAIISALLPEGDYTLSEHFRLHPAICIQTLPVKDPDDYSEMVYLSAGQNKSYKVDEEDKDNILTLFENIHYMSRPEGFCVWSENANPARKDTFEAQFLSTFRGSYLPIYLYACLADLCLNDSIEKMKEGKLKPAQMKQLREMKLIGSLPVSSFHHLSRLADVINKQVFNLPVKVEATTDFIDNARFEIRSHTEKRLNLCVLALTVSQVVFALIQYLGIKDVLGDRPEPLQSYSPLLIIVTLCLILTLTIPWERLKKK